MIIVLTGVDIKIVSNLSENENGHRTTDERKILKPAFKPSWKPSLGRLRWKPLTVYGHGPVDKTRKKSTRKHGENLVGHDVAVTVALCG
jgi:hypothetical protein